MRVPCILERDDDSRTIFVPWQGEPGAGGKPGQDGEGRTLLAVILALIMVCVLASTPETRAAGAEWAKPYGRLAIVIIVVVVGWELIDRAFR